MYAFLVFLEVLGQGLNLMERVWTIVSFCFVPPIVPSKSLVTYRSGAKHMIEPTRQPSVAGLGLSGWTR